MAVVVAVVAVAAAEAAVLRACTFAYTRFYPQHQRDSNRMTLCTTDLLYLDLQYIHRDTQLHTCF
jgi:hypothetical protein